MCFPEHYGSTKGAMSHLHLRNLLLSKARSGSWKLGWQGGRFLGGLVDGWGSCQQRELLPSQELIARPRKLVTPKVQIFSTIDFLVLSCFQWWYSTAICCKTCLVYDSYDYKLRASSLEGLDSIIEDNPTIEMEDDPSVEFDFLQMIFP